MITIKDIMHGHIGDRKEIPLLQTFFFFLKDNTLFYLAMQVLHLSEHNFYNLHTCVHDWRSSNSGEMIIYAFLLGFSSPYDQNNMT